MSRCELKNAGPWARLAKKQVVSIVEVPIPMKERVSGISMHKGYRGLLNWFEASRVLIEYRFFLSNYEKNDYRI